MSCSRVEPDAEADALHRNSAYLGWTQGPGTRSRRVPDDDSNCRLLIVPPFRGSSRFESLILSHHSRTKLHVSVMNEVKAASRRVEEVLRHGLWLPRQSIRRGRQKSIFCSRQWFSTVESADIRAFE